MIGPDTPSVGEVKGEGQYYQNQVARTMAALLGLDYKPEKPVGDSIGPVLGGNNSPRPLVVTQGWFEICYIGLYKS